MEVKTWLLTLIGTTVGLALSEIFGFFREKRAEKRKDTDFIRQKRYEIYLEVVQATFKMHDIALSKPCDYAPEDLPEEIDRFFDTILPKAELVSSKNTRNNVSKAFGWYLQGLDQGIPPNFFEELESKCKAVVESMRTELNIED